jgi:hypothetical protein
MAILPFAGPGYRPRAAVGARRGAASARGSLRSAPALGYAHTFRPASVDRATFARTPKPSPAWLGEVARRNAL